MRTRAQRQKDQAAGVPTSPAHQLPLNPPRRTNKSRNAARNSPARTAIRNATRKAIERESSGETTDINNSFRNDATSNAQSSEVAAEPDIAKGRDGDILDHADIQTEGSPTSIKRKPTDDAENSRPARRVRFANDESPSKRIIGYKPAPLYTDKGKLLLGQPDIPIYEASDSEEDEEGDSDMDKGAEDGENSNDNSPALASNSMQQQQVSTYHVIETPSRWGIGKILDSAAKYVPGLRSRAKPVAIPFPLTISPPVPSDQSQTQHPRTEPRWNTQPVIAAKTPVTAQPDRRSRRADKTHPDTNKVTKPKRETARNSQRMSRRNKHLQDEVNAQVNAAEEKARNSQIEREFIADQIRIVNEEQARKRLVALQQWRAEKKANPGLKRKRPPSPEVIPNPPGCSYGFDPDYFVIDDTDDSEPPSPTPERPSKSRRVDGPPDPLVGSKKKAQPYKGVFFRDLTETPSYDGGNVFRELAVENASAEKAATVKKSAVGTPKKPKIKEPPRTPSGVPITNLSGHFTVPDDSDEDEESETSEVSPNSASGKTASIAAGSESATPAASPAKSTEQQATSSSQATSSTPLKSKAQAWTQPPPPPPNPSHASLPSIASTGSESLKAARAKALQHAPRKPSGLRESSHITSSPVVANENDAASQSSAEKQKTVRFALDAATAESEQAVDTQEASATTQPPLEQQKTTRSASDEAIAQLERDVANNPTPPLNEVLGVLAEKAPNGQTKSPAQASPSLEKEAATKTVSSPFNAPKTPIKTAPFSPVNRPKSPEGYYLSNGQYISKNVQLSVDAQRTPEVVRRQNDGLELDFRGWLRRQPPSPPSKVTLEVSQEQLDRGANATVNNYYGWSKNNPAPSI